MARTDFQERWGNARAMMDDVIEAAKKAHPDFADDLQAAYDDTEGILDVVDDLLDEMDHEE